MRRATPLGHGKNTPPAPDQEHHPNPAPAETPVPEEQPQYPRPFSVVRGGAPAERQRRTSGEHRRRTTPARAVVQPSDPERLRRALAAMREMNQLTRKRTAELKQLSVLSRDLAQQMQAFGSVIGGLRIAPERKSAGG
ncbi:MAG: hypothetical protein ABR499_15400 [Gemmatimonadaceae bacterium]